MSRQAAADAGETQSSSSSSSEESDQQDRNGVIKERRFKCNECGKTFKAKFNLTTHRRTHDDPDKRMRFSCDQCDKSYTQKGNLTLHINAVHLNIKPYTCDECDYSTVWKNHLYEHVKIHLNPNKRKKFRCKKCNMYCFTLTGLTSHVRRVHARPQELTCSWPDCHFMASCPSNLQIHTDAVHQKVYRFPCPSNKLSAAAESCMKMFKRKGDAAKHYRQVHLKELYPCPLASCNGKFTSTPDVRNHYRRVHEGDSAKWRCPHCRKLLATSSGLLTHIDEVHNKTRSSCDLCGRSFAGKSSLYGHKAREHFNKNYK